MSLGFHSEVYLSHSLSAFSLHLLTAACSCECACREHCAEGGCAGVRVRCGGMQESQLFISTGVLLRCPRVIWCFTEDVKYDICEMYSGP